MGDRAVEQKCLPIVCTADSKKKKIKKSMGPPHILYFSLNNRERLNYNNIIVIFGPICYSEKKYTNSRTN